MKKYLTVIIAFFILANSFAQNRSDYRPLKYLVDSQINQQLKKYPTAEAGVLKKSMQIEVYMNNNLFFDQKDYLDCYTETILHGDTLLISGKMLTEIGYGFQLVLFRDSCIIASFAYSDSTIYKYNRSDTTLTDFILAGSLTQKLVLAKKPTFKEGDIVSGMVELTSREFYYGLTNPEDRFTINIKAYFKTAAIQPGVRE